MRAPNAYNHRMVRCTLNMYGGDALCPCTGLRQMHAVRCMSDNVYSGTGRLGSGKHAAERLELICVTHRHALL